VSACNGARCYYSFLRERQGYKEKVAYRILDDLYFIHLLNVYSLIVWSS
jgi:hypothetical protein